MDQGQTFNIVDTPSKDRRFWPAPEAFQEREEIAKWRNIQQGIYKAHELQYRGRNKIIWAIDPVEVGARKWPNNIVVGAVFANLHVAKQRAQHIFNVGLKETEKGKMFDFKPF